MRSLVMVAAIALAAGACGANTSDIHCTTNEECPNGMICGSAGVCIPITQHNVADAGQDAWDANDWDAWSTDAKVDHSDRFDAPPPPPVDARVDRPLPPAPDMLVPDARPPDMGLPREAPLPDGCPAMESFTLPATGDSVLSSYFRAGDTLSGTRSLSLRSATSLTGSIYVSNPGICSALTFDVYLNCVDVGSFTIPVGSGDKVVPISLTFPEVYALKPSGCGGEWTVSYVESAAEACYSVSFPLDNASSTLTLAK